MRREASPRGSPLVATGRENVVFGQMFDEAGALERHGRKPRRKRAGAVRLSVFKRRDVQLLRDPKELNVRVVAKDRKHLPVRLGFLVSDDAVVASFRDELEYLVVMANDRWLTGVGVTVVPCENGADREQDCVVRGLGRI